MADRSKQDGVGIPAGEGSENGLRTLIEGMTASPDPLFAPSRRDDLSSHRHRLIIGTLGLLLPVVLWVMSGSRPTPGLPDWEVLNSVSAYYYSGASTAFVGVLVALAVFLLTYRGYGNQYRRRDQCTAIIAGGAALGVAFFPTGPPSAVPAPQWWTPNTRTIHYISAVVLFAAFVFFSLFLFPKSGSEGSGGQSREKRRRNLLYRSCGLLMLLCILWAASALVTQAPIFWPEAFALEAFSLSWLVKGHADWTARSVGRRVAHYGRHPKQFASDLRKAVLG